MSRACDLSSQGSKNMLARVLHLSRLVDIAAVRMVFARRRWLSGSESKMVRRWRYRPSSSSRICSSCSRSSGVICSPKSSYSKMGADFDLAGAGHGVGAAHHARFAFCGCLDWNQNAHGGMSIADVWEWGCRGANGRTRTVDLLFTKQLLCRLSYVGSPCPYYYEYCAVSRYSRARRPTARSLHGSGAWRRWAQVRAPR